MDRINNVTVEFFKREITYKYTFFEAINPLYISLVPDSPNNNSWENVLFVDKDEIIALGYIRIKGVENILLIKFINNNINIIYDEFYYYIYDDNLLWKRYMRDLKPCITLQREMILKELLEY